MSFWQVGCKAKEQSVVRVRWYNGLSAGTVTGTIICARSPGLEKHAPTFCCRG